MKTSSIVAIVSILIVVSIMVLIGIKVVRDIVRNDASKQNLDEANDQTTKDLDESQENQSLETNFVEDSYQENISDEASFNQRLVDNPLDIEGGNEVFPNESFDVEMPAGIIIVQTISRNIPEEIIQSKAKVEEINPEQIDDSDNDWNNELETFMPQEESYEDFDAQSRIPIDTSVNILNIDETTLRRIEYVDIDSIDDSDSAKIILDTYEEDDGF